MTLDTTPGLVPPHFIRTVNELATPQSIQMPSYLRKTRLGSMLNKQFEKAKKQQSLSKEEIRSNLISQLSLKGILGSNPGLCINNKEYIDDLINTFEKKAIAKSILKGESPDTSGCGTTNRSMDSVNDYGITQDSSNEDNGSNGSISGQQIHMKLEDETPFNLSDLQFYSNSTLSNILPIPSKWMRPPECKFDISSDGLEISTKDLIKPQRAPGYLAPSTTNRNKMFSTRSNHKISRSLAIYYFEVEILFGLNSGADVSIGFIDFDKISSNNGDNDDDEQDDNADTFNIDLRGHDENCWGYCGKEGKLLSYDKGRVVSKSTLKFGNGDIIGCGVNFIDNVIFITKNGSYIGEAFKVPDKISSVVPGISLAQWNAVKTNFGLDVNEKFRFNIDGYVQAFKNDQFKKIEEFVPPKNMKFKGIDDSSDLKKLINNIIKSYFIHMGLADSLKAFEKDLELEGTSFKITDKEEEDILVSSTEFKKQIKNAMMNDDLDQVTEPINLKYPFILQNSEIIRFRLSCLKLVILIKNELIDESLKLASQIKSEFKNNKNFQEYLSLILQLLSFKDVTKSRYFNIFYHYEKDKLIDILISCINYKIGLPTESNLDRIVLKIDSNLSEEDPGLELIDLIEDFITL